MPKSKYKYEPIDRYKERPVHTTWKGGIVAIGGDSLIPRSKPKQDIVVPEATQEQYQELYENGFSHVIKKVKIEEDVQTKKSITTEPEG